MGFSQKQHSQCHDYCQCIAKKITYGMRMDYKWQLVFWTSVRLSNILGFLAVKFSTARRKWRNIAYPYICIPSHYQSAHLFHKASRNRDMDLDHKNLQKFISGVYEYLWKTSLDLLLAKNLETYHMSMHATSICHNQIFALWTFYHFPSVQLFDADYLPTTWAYEFRNGR